MMGDQEFLQDEEESMSILRSLHHASKTAADQLARTALFESLDKCTNSSTKLHSSPLPSQFQEPIPKQPIPCAAASPPDYNFLGYTKVQLPHSFPAASPPPNTPLRRTLSEPIYSPVTNKSSAPQELIQFPNAVAAQFTPTPPRPPAGRNSSRSPSFGGSHRTKRMKRMRARIRELWNQVASEDGDEDECDEQENCYCNDNNSKEESENDGEDPSTQEAVWVEKNGESLVLHFKCPCGNGYEVLLSGTSCYYKLTNF